MKCKYPNSYNVLRARRRPPAPSARRLYLGRGAGVHATPFSQKKEVKGNLHKNSITTCHNWRRAGDNNPIRYLFYCPPSRSHTPTPLQLPEKKWPPLSFHEKNRLTNSKFYELFVPRNISLGSNCGQIWQVSRFDNFWLKLLWKFLKVFLWFVFITKVFTDPMNITK